MNLTLTYKRLVFPFLALLAVAGCTRTNPAVKPSPREPARSEKPEAEIAQKPNQQLQQPAAQSQSAAATQNPAVQTPTVANSPANQPALDTRPPSPPTNVTNFPVVVVPQPSQPSVQTPPVSSPKPTATSSPSAIPSPSPSLVPKPSPSPSPSPSAVPTIAPSPSVSAPARPDLTANGNVKVGNLMIKSSTEMTVTQAATIQGASFASFSSATSFAALHHQPGTTNTLSSIFLNGARTTSVEAPMRVGNIEWKTIATSRTTERGPHAGTVYVFGFLLQRSEGVYFGYGRASTADAAKSAAESLMKSIIVAGESNATELTQ